MNPSQPEHVYRAVVVGLGIIALIVLVAVGVVLATSFPPTAAQIAATLAALPSAPVQTPTPTSVPPVPGTSPELLVCQREAGQAMNEREMVGAVNVSDDHRLLMSWVSTRRAVRGLDDALSGVILGFEAALETWDRGCAVYDRVQIEVYDGPRDQQIHRLSVEAGIDDLLKWHEGEYRDQELVARLEVAQPEIPE
jgi:hypothetical protein